MSATPVPPAGFRIVSLDSVDSTNAEALRRIAAGAGAGTVVRAGRQTAGRGRRGRSWESPAGNLYATLVAHVPAGGIAGQLAFVAALAAGDAVRPVLPAGRQLTVKWPNDLMLDGRKLGGILIEGADNRTATDLYVVGIGLNVATAPANAASLHAAGVKIAVDDLLHGFLTAFGQWRGIWETDGFPPLRAAWLAVAEGLGRPVAVRFPDGSVRKGLFRDIDERGALVLEEADRTTARIATGEVFFAAA